MRSSAFFAALLLATGCGGPYQTAGVSGRVTLDGKPLPHAAVMFSPVGEGNVNPGPTSSGVTDAEGRYTLTLDISKERGAVVGKHKVRIAYMAEPTDPNDDRRRKMKSPGPPIPAKYTGKATRLEWTVAGGTDAANFELWTDPKK
jgi:hypothetical protein